MRGEAAFGVVGQPLGSRRLVDDPVVFRGPGLADQPQPEEPPFK